MRQIGKMAFKVTNRSGFDKSHRNLFTGKVGTLYPILVDELLPNSTIHLKEAISAKLPPLAADTFMNVQLKIEAFFCPNRLLYKGWENWLLETPLRNPNGTSYTLDGPVLKIAQDDVAPGTLFDYLGFKSVPDQATGNTYLVNPYPWVAYSRIWDCWYRNSRIQAPLFVPMSDQYTKDAGVEAFYSIANLPFIDIVKGNQTNVSPYRLTKVFDATKTDAASSLLGSGYLADGSYITDLRQRNFGLDYFTAAMPTAQKGNARQVRMSINGTTVDVMNETGDGVQATYDADEGLSGSFTIAALRAENSLQIFAERNNYSYKAEDYYYINYGARLKRGLADRPIFLGQQTIDVYSKSVYQTTPASGESSTNNPFNSVGAQYSVASMQGADTLVPSFTTDEPGVFMVLCSLVPRVTYNTGTRALNWHFTEEGSQTDLANAVLQNVGNQPIFKSELTDMTEKSTVFGYTDRYAEWMDMYDEVHGLLKDGQSLQAFALQRSFDSATLNGNFLQIPTTYLDQVAAVQVGESGFSYWAEVYFKYHVVQPLNEYSIPSLQDPAYEHGKTVVVNRNGSSL